MISLHRSAILATATAVPFTTAEATAAATGICGRYTRHYLRQVMLARRVVRRNIASAIKAGHLLQANEHATLAHSLGVQAVLMIRAGARCNRTGHTIHVIH